MSGSNYTNSGAFIDIAIRAIAIVGFGFVVAVLLHTLSGTEYKDGPAKTGEAQVISAQFTPAHSEVYPSVATDGQGNTRITINTRYISDEWVTKFQIEGMTYIASDQASYLAVKDKVGEKVPVSYVITYEMEKSGPEGAPVAIPTRIKALRPKGRLP